jgi:hypothetical protein
MIASLAETVTGLTGALRLARFDATGMRYFDPSPAATARSFFAALLIAPFYALLLVARFPEFDPAINPVRFAAAETIGYVLSWVIFPVIMWQLASMLDRRSQFFIYITAYNWSMVWQSVIFLIIAFAGLTGLIPTDAASILWLLSLLFILGYVWFIARTALDIPGFTAAGLVGLDFVLTVFVNGTIESVY